MKLTNGYLAQLSKPAHRAGLGRQLSAMGLSVCMAGVSFAKDEPSLHNLPQLVTQWKQALASGELSELLPLYAKSDQAKVAQAFPRVKTGQVQLPFVAEMVDGRWVMRADDLPLPEAALAPAQQPPSDAPPPLALAVTPVTVAVQAQAEVPPVQSASTPAPMPTPTQTYAVSVADQNFRKVLKRWTSASGWMFEPEHWGVNRDIPVSGNEAVVADFKTAVRHLLKSTLLTELPVQPCFYSNKVLRVIPATELCARSEN